MNSPQFVHEAGGQAEEEYQRVYKLLGCSPRLTSVLEDIRHGGARITKDSIMDWASTKKPSSVISGKAW